MKNWVESTSSKTFQILDLSIWWFFKVEYAEGAVELCKIFKYGKNWWKLFLLQPIFRPIPCTYPEKKNRISVIGSTQRGSTSTIIIASGRTRAYWFWFISCIMSGNIHLEILWSKMIFFPLLVFCAKCCFNICCEKNQINPSSCWFDVPPLRLHLSIIPNFNINCADSGLSRTLWTVVLFLGVHLSFPFKKGLLRKYFIHMEQSF